MTAELVFASVRPFEFKDNEAWWLAFDMVSRVVHTELGTSDRILRATGRPPLAARGVLGAGNPAILSKYIKVEGWEPINVAITITDIAGVIEKFGGEKLYGPKPESALRELIANSSDAIRARRSVALGGLKSREGQIEVRLTSQGSDEWLEIEDDGVGMSASVLQGPLLDFGSSFWSSGLATQEFPGLLSGTFRPTGKFGIGFFSVFMLSDQVEVTSRRYDSAVADTWCLDVRQGRRHQTLRRTVAAKNLPRGGTLVRLKLKHALWSKKGLFKELETPKRTDAQAKLGALAILIRFIAPALDVKVIGQVRADDHPSLEQAIIKPEDWMALPFDKLMRRITGNQIESTDPISNYIFVPEEDGKVLGRLRLTNRGYSFRSRLIATVGGFKASISEGSHMPLEGIILGSDPLLSRAEATACIPADIMKRELEKAVESGFLRHKYSQATLASFILQHGVVPVGLKCFDVGGPHTSSYSYDSNGLVERLREMKGGERIVFISDQSFEYSDPLGDHHTASIATQLDQLEFEESVLVVREPGLYEFALKLISEAWGSSPEDFLSDEDLVIATYDGGTEISASCEVATRMA
jgi:hypothetical protein